MKTEKFTFKNPETEESFDFDVHSGDMNALRQLYALQEKIISMKDEKLSAGDIVALYDKILAWVDFVIGDGGFNKIFGEHYGLQEIMYIFTALGNFVIDSAKSVNEKYSADNIGVPNEPADKSIAQ